MTKRLTKNSLNIKLESRLHQKGVITSQKDIKSEYYPIHIREMSGLAEQKAASPTELATNLEIVTSKQYQDLVAKLRMLKAEKDAELDKLR